MSDDLERRTTDGDREHAAELVQWRGAVRQRLRQEAVGAGVAFAVCTAIWLAVGADGSFWPLWVGLVVLLPLLRSGRLLYGPAPDPDRVGQELVRERERNSRFERRRDRRARR